MTELPINKDEFTVFIGEKDKNSYIVPVIIQAKQFDTVMIKARGNQIGKAVDVSQIVINKMLTGWFISNVKLDTEEMPYRNQGDMNSDIDPHNQKFVEETSQDVSTIEIELSKK